LPHFVVEVREKRRLTSCRGGERLIDLPHFVVKVGEKRSLTRFTGPTYFHFVVQFVNASLVGHLFLADFIEDGVEGFFGDPMGFLKWLRRCGRVWVRGGIVVVVAFVESTERVSGVNPGLGKFPRDRGMERGDFATRCDEAVVRVGP
jgi:hypothetical protein